MKKNITGPFYFLLIFGILDTLFIIGIILTLTSLNAPRHFNIWGFFINPAVLLIEASVYWLIRKKNRNPRASWTHVILMTLAFLTPAIRGLTYFFFDRITVSATIGPVFRTANIIQAVLFWGLLILAHIYFVRVLKSTRSKPAQTEAASSENLLDDLAP